MGSMETHRPARITGTSVLPVVPGREWHVRCEPRWGQKAPAAPVWSVLCPAAWHANTGSLWTWLSLGPTRYLHSEVPFCFCLPFQISRYSFDPWSILSDFISDNHSPLCFSTSVTKTSISGAEGCLLRAKRDTVIRLICHSVAFS